MMITRAAFETFYRTTYREDHKHPANRALHMIGTVAGLAMLVASVTVIPLWWALSFPFVHAVPGLIGHRLFDRNEALGDIRIFSGTVPVYWYMIANHLMTVDVVWSTLPGRRRHPR
jgi:hypothetical protein